MDQPLVTVVIPVYNVEDHLNRCVESVVNQTYSNLEIILVDDGSPDRCPQMCDDWAAKDARIYVIHKENAGLGMARNTGIGAAKGTYIFFFDSDDWVDLSIVEKCVREAETQSSDVVAFGRWDVYENGKKKSCPISAEKRIYRNKDVCWELLPKLFTYELGIGVSACGKMYRLRMIKERNLRFLSEREIISEDAFFMLELFSVADSVSIVPEALYCYYKRDTSLSRVFRRDRQTKNDRFLEDSVQYAKDAGLPETVISHLKVRYHFYTIAAMKQAEMSGLPADVRRAVVWEMFRSPVLRSTLTADVLRLEKPAMRIFFLSLKLRCHWLCYGMIQYKTKRE